MGKITEVTKHETLKSKSDYNNDKVRHAVDG